ncbi:PAS domain S-box protein [Thermodesulfobacteriota bacterium]
MARKPANKDMAEKVKYLEKEIAKYKKIVSEDFKRLADRSQDVIYHYNIASAKFTFFNKMGLERYGFGTKKSVLLLIHPDDRDKVRKAAKDSLKPGCNNGEVEYRIVSQNGPTRWMHDRWIVIRNSSDQPIAIEGIIRDNTERKLTEEALRESKGRYRLLVETMNDGLGIQDEDGLLTYVNDEFCKMLGYSEADLLGNPVMKFFDKTDRGIFKDQLSRRGRGGGRHYKITWTRKDGEKIHTIVSPRPIFDGKGNFKGSFAVITDISHQKEVEHALKEREKELEIKTINLEDLNSALKVLLKRRAEDKIELEENIISNIKELVDPFFKKLKSSGLDERQHALFNIIESNLNEIISPFLNRLSSVYRDLTPTETQVANFIKQGKSTKEIAEILMLSRRTIEFHRDNIRKKLGLKNKKLNLRTYLLSFQQHPTRPDISHEDVVTPGEMK